MGFAQFQIPPWRLGLFLEPCICCLLMLLSRLPMAMNVQSPWRGGGILKPYFAFQFEGMQGRYKWHRVVSGLCHWVSTRLLPSLLYIAIGQLMLVFYTSVTSWEYRYRIQTQFNLGQWEETPISPRMASVS